jgi:hypothetical protein
MVRYCVTNAGVEAPGAVFSSSVRTKIRSRGHVFSLKNASNIMLGCNSLAAAAWCYLILYVLSAATCGVFCFAVFTSVIVGI